MALVYEWLLLEGEEILELNMYFVMLEKKKMLDMVEITSNF